MKLISIIVPCLNEQEVIPIFYRTVTEVLDSLENAEYELLFVDDGSDDRTLKVLKELKKKDRRCRYLSFTRNFGKEAAIYAGLTHAKGDYVGLMDVDLQDPPKFLGEMYRTLETGEYDCVAARRTDRAGERRIRSFFSAMFYKVINKISKIEFVEGARDYRLMTRKMRDAVLKMGEYNRFSKGIFGWIGFRTYWLPYENVNRVAGETKWNFWKLLKYAIDGIINFSQAPLAVASWFGMGMTLLSFIAVIFIVVRKLVFGDPVTGWASTACIITFIGGVQLFCMGIMGQYIAKTYMEVKQRPHYIVAESNRAEVTRIK